MNEKLKNFIAGIGAMTEVWTMTYKNFIEHGYTSTEALTHTREFMSALIHSIMVYGKEENTDG